MIILLVCLKLGCTSKFWWCLDEREIRGMVIDGLGKRRSLFQGVDMVKRETFIGISWDDDG